MTRSLALAALTLVVPVAASPALAQSADPTDRTVTAAFVEAPPRIDGRLDDALWVEIAPVTAFTQVFPQVGAAATEATEVYVAYDRDFLYFAFRNRDRNPDLIRARNLVRGGPNADDDHLYIGLDTYRDGRNAYLFEINALGTQDDALITDENITFDSFSWDAVFRSETHIDDTGWSAELAIPFRQLRFPEGEELSFGLMFHRGIRRKNERVSWPAISREGFGAIAQVSEYGVLRGIRGIRRGR
ncbi:MAG: carbohydrate binding family 9 domain-containing protein, partial [Bacteroidota bacterium]